MLGKLLGRGSDPEPKPGPQLAMPFFGSTEPVNPTLLIKAWAKLWPEEPPLKLEEDKDGVQSYECNGGSVMLLHVPAPIPKPELEEAAERSWMWPEAGKFVGRQIAHAIVTSPQHGSHEEAVFSACRISMFIRALIESHGAIGVYWGNSGQVHSAKTFSGFAEGADGSGPPPVMLWVGLLISADSPNGPFTLSTHGMRPFGHREIEVIDTRMPVGDLRMLLYDFIGYLLTSGPVVKHGQTIGLSAEQKLKVRVGPSKFVPNEKRMFVEIP